MWKLLTNDAVTLNLFNNEELSIVSEALELVLTKLSKNCTASFYQGDLGTHNVLVGSKEGLRCIGTVIDFGNSTFAPSYFNNYYTRKFGGFGLEEIDVFDSYSIAKEEYESNNLVNDFDSTIFFSMLDLRAGNDPKPRIDNFMKSCKNYPYME